MSYGNQKGVALLAVIFFLVVMAFVGVIFISLSSTNTSQSVNEVYSSQAFYIAEGGLERSGRYLLKREDGTCTTCTCASMNGSALFTNNSLGNGQFTVTTVDYNNTMTPTTLFAVTASTDLTIPVNSVTGYAPFGQIMMDRERINYSLLGTTAAACNPANPPCFLGAIRGADNTVAVNHAAGIPVAQTECLLTSTGGVSTISAGSNQRMVSQTDVIQSGFMVGQPGGSAPQWPLTIDWNGTSWTTQNNAALSINQPLYSVFCLNAADCWAVGQNSGPQGTILNWNGITWATTNAGATTINQPLNSVYCNSGNDCWAVGNASGVAATIVHWNGISWATTNAGATTLGQNLNSVYCVATNLCWAVGHQGSSASTKPLILYWYGTSWTTNNSNLNVNNALNSVFCTSSSDCWAVGDSSGRTKPLIVHWDGTTWTENASISINDDLQSIHCVSTSYCWAVGISGGPAKPFIIFWNGTVWSLVNTGAPNQNYNEVYCIAAADCWAAGANGTLIHWNGIQWIAEGLGGITNQLNSLSLVAPKRPNIAWREVVQ